MKKIKIIVSALFTLFALTACMDDLFKQHGLVEEGQPATVQIKVKTTADRQKFTRSSLLESEERKIHELCLCIFNSSGKLEYMREYSRKDLQSGTSPTKTDEAATDFGLLTDIHITTGRKTFFILANGKDGEGGVLQVLTSYIRNLGTLDDLNALQAVMTEKTLFRPNGSLLMSSSEEVVVTPLTQRVEMELKRSDAKITFRVQTAEGLSFEPKSYRVGNVPKSTYVRLHEKGTDPAAPWDSGADRKQDYWTSEPQNFEGDKSNTTLTFYMPESRKPAKRAITPELPEYDRAKGGYNLRQKQEKLPLADAVEKPSVQNGATVYAPDLAPYIEIEGYLTQELNGTGGATDTNRFGHLVYRIYLGYTSPTDPVNDYDIERNVHYTYNVCIRGMEDVVVEAQSDKEQEQEPSPGVEGLVYDAYRSFYFDSHYEQGLIRFPKSEFQVFKDDGSLRDNASVTFVVSTPFCYKAISYTADELTRLKDRNWLVDSDKRADTDWLRFYIHPATLSDNDNDTMVHYSDVGTDYLLTLEQFLYRLIHEPDYVFNARTGRCKVTVFVDEYFYERDPMRDNAPQDRNLWKTFANASDRRFDLLAGNLLQVSPDGESFYYQSLVSVRQTSIKTVFVNSPEGMRVWGVESVNETPNLDFMVKAASEPDAFYNKYYANGWSNTWKLMARRAYAGGFSGDILPDPMAKGKENTLWQVMTKVDNAKLTLSRDHYNVALKNYHADYACFAPFLRNRDDNRDGQVQASEIKWYIPSIAETTMLYVGERALPLNCRLYGYAPSDKATAFFTSRSYMGPDNASLNSPNDMIFVAESHSMTPLLNFDFLQGGLPGSRTPYSGVRLIRDLGVLEGENSSVSYHVAEMDSELRTTLDRGRTMNDYLTFKADHLSPNTLRSARSIYELPQHHENSQVNTIYKNGFEVARYMANKRDTPKDLDNPNIVGDYYYETWSTLMEDIERGESPCDCYYQEQNQSDKGTWRVPNEAELQVMVGSLFDWDDREKRDVYNFGSSLPSFNIAVAMGSGYVIHSRTGYSGRPMNASGLFSAGYQMYIEGYLRFVSTVDTRWVSNSQRLLNTKKGYVRCVRDNKY